MRRKFLPLLILCFAFTVQSQITTFPYSENFNAGAGAWTASGTLWEHGIPTSTNMVAEHSTCRGNIWATNLAGNYVNNANAMLTSPVFDFTSFATDPVIHFDMDRYLENCCDEVWFEVTYDAGVTWTKVLGPGINWYNDATNEWWDDNSNGWTNSQLTLTGAAGQSAVQYRFVFDSDGSTSEEGIAIDNIYIGDGNFVDLELVQVLSPTNGANLTSTEAITVVITNNGPGTVNFADYSICVSGDLPQSCESTVTSIPGNTTVNITLALTTADLSAYGIYDINFYLSMTTPDMNLCNDTLAIEVENIITISSYPYSENFNAGSGSWTASGTLWDYGVPTSTNMAADHSTCRGNIWATKLTGNYDNNANAMLTSPVFDFTSLATDPVINFDMNRYLENCCDEVWFEVTYDAGVTWTKVLGPGTNWYNDLGNDWWDDNSNGWMASQITLTGAAGQSAVQYRFVFDSDSSNSEEGVAIDNVYIGDGNFSDLELVQVLSPTTGLNLTGTEAITVVITNNGPGAVNFADYSICVSGDLPQSCESTVTSIPGNTTVNITLALTTADLSAYGIYDINFYLSMTTPDMNLCNDTLAIQVENINAIVTFPYFEDFENGAGTWTTSGSLWEVGVPSTTNMTADNSSCTDSSFVTNLSGNYPTNALNYLTSTIFDFSALTADPIVRFDINRYLENCCDEVWMEITFDGLTWQKVDGPGVNWYNDLSNEWWDSNTNGWVSAEAVLVGSAGEGLVQVRFVFDSDASTSEEGVGIDNIFIGDAADQIDLAIIDLISPVTNCGILSATEPIIVVVANNGIAPVNFADYAVCYDGDVPQACESTIITLAPNTTDTITLLGTIDLSVVGSYTYDFSINHAQDFKTCNDSMSFTVDIIEAQVSNLGIDTTSCDMVTLDAGTAEAILWSTGETTSTIDINATDTVMLELTTLGCPALFDTVIVTINSASTSTDVTTQCSPFTWIDGNVYTADNNVATFTLIDAAANGCDSIVTIDLTITSVDVATNLVDLTIIAPAAGTYQWVDCDDSYSLIAGETDQIFTPTTNGNYAVIVTVSGCSDTSACVAINNVGINEFALNDDFKLYPNPTEGNVVIEFATVQEGFTINLMTLSGTLVESKSVSNTNRVELSIEGAPGVYLVEMFDNEMNRSVIRVVKK